jgi:alkanesulfonate monooxygenase SsuD/methylene tetrahydromethanopterin reductase-like flavin-dependent oxidoreductase (luciferase family)
VGLYGTLGVDEVRARAALERGRAAFPAGAMGEEPYESWRADTLSGTPEQVRERIEAFAVIGVEEIIWSPWVLPFAIPEPEMVELFADAILGPR